MAKSKALTQEQQDFLRKFVGEDTTRQQEKKLTSQYKDFLRRKTKVLGEVYKLAPEDPVRIALLDQVAQIDQSKEGQDGTANFKDAYEALKDVKRQARRVARGLPALAYADVEKRIQTLARIGMRRSRQATDIIEKVDPLLTELRKPENKASSCPTLEAALEFRTRFGNIEDGLRAQLVNLGKAKNDIVIELQQFPLQEKEQSIKGEIAYLQELDPQSAAPLPELLEKAKAAFIPVAAVEQRFADKAAQFEILIKECKSLGNFQQRQQQPLPESFQELEQRDERRKLLTEMLLDHDKLTDELTFWETQDKPKQVEAPYDWSNSAGFQNFTDGLPETLDEITPQIIENCVQAAKQMIEDLFRNNGQDQDLVFDLSIQTPQTLQSLILNQLPIDISPQPSENLVQLRDTVRQQPNGIKTDVYKLVNRFLGAQDQYQVDGDIEKYRKVLTAVMEACDKKLGNQEFCNAPANATAVAQFRTLRDALRPGFERLQKAITLAQPIAQQMHETINQNCPNRTSGQTQNMKVKLPDGNEIDFPAPQTITFNNKQWTLKKALGSGAFGVALRYEDPDGKAMVVKAALDESDQSRNKFHEELKMHKHLMGGGDEGKSHVLKLEGSVRGPDGSLYMLMEEAGGGTLDKLGENLRALNGTGVLSQECQNIINQHFIRQAIIGLKYLQDRNMTHHDIKSDNFFLGSDGTLKLSDFGSSQVGYDEEGNVIGPKHRNIEGARQFQSPELENNSMPTLTGKSDTYTLGAIIVSLMSPTDAKEKYTGLGRGEFKSKDNVTALSRLVNAMLDEDPKNRPTLEAIQMSMFLQDDKSNGDPELIQALMQASLAYSQKVGGEVRDRQEKIGSINGDIIQGQQKSGPDNDETLNGRLQHQPNAEKLIQADLDTAAMDVQQIRGMLKDYATLFEQLRTSNLAPDERARQTAELEERYFADVRGRFKNGISNAMKNVGNAQRFYELANLNNDALRRKIADQRAVVEHESLSLLKLLQDRAAELKKQIEAINQRDDVKPFVEAVQRAQQALVRGPETPGKKPPTPEDQARAIRKRQEKLEKLSASLIAKDDDKRLDLSQKLLKRATRYVKLERFEDAAKVLDRLEKMLHKLGGLKLFEKQLHEAIDQANHLEGEEKTKVEAILKQAIIAATAKKMDEAYEHYQKVARMLRKRELEKELVSA